MTNALAIIPCINLTTQLTTRCAYLKLIFQLVQLNLICFLHCLNSFVSKYTTLSKRKKKLLMPSGDASNALACRLCNTSETWWISWPPEWSRGVKQLSPQSPGVRAGRSGCTYTARLSRKSDRLISLSACGQLSHTWLAYDVPHSAGLWPKLCGNRFTL